MRSATSSSSPWAGPWSSLTAISSSMSRRTRGEGIDSLRVNCATERPSLSYSIKARFKRSWISHLVGSHVLTMPASDTPRKPPSGFGVSRRPLRHLDPADNFAIEREHGPCAVKQQIGRLVECEIRPFDRLRVRPLEAELLPVVGVDTFLMRQQDASQVARILPTPASGIRSRLRRRSESPSRQQRCPNPWDSSPLAQMI